MSDQSDINNPSKFTDDHIMICITVLNYQSIRYTISDHYKVLEELIKRLEIGKMQEHKLDIIRELSIYSKRNIGEPLNRLVTDVLKIIKNG